MLSDNKSNQGKSPLEAFKEGRNKDRKNRDNDDYDSAADEENKYVDTDRKDGGNSTYDRNHMF